MWGSNLNFYYNCAPILSLSPTPCRLLLLLRSSLYTLFLTSHSLPDESLPCAVFRFSFQHTPLTYSCMVHDLLSHMDTLHPTLWVVPAAGVPCLLPTAASTSFLDHVETSLPFTLSARGGVKWGPLDYCMRGRGMSACVVSAHSPRTVIQLQYVTVSRIHGMTRLQTSCMWDQDVGEATSSPTHQTSCA